MILVSYAMIMCLIVFYLNSDFWQVDFHCQFLPAVNIRIVTLLKSPLQFMELVGGEGCPVAAVLLLVRVIISISMTVTLSTIIRVMAIN